MPTAEMQRVGETLDAFFAYEPMGGVCVRPGCDGEAPFVTLGSRRVAMPCAIHAAEDSRSRETEELAARAERYMARAGASVRLAPWSFDSYREKCGDKAGLAALAVAAQWAEDYYAATSVDDETEVVRSSAPNLLLYGPIGSGKTGLAWATVRDVIEHGYEARLVNFRSLLDAMKDCFSKREPITSALGVGKVQVLALDDLGSETPTKWAREQLLGIVDYRYEMRLPTIYISNYDPENLAKRLGHDDPVIGERIVSRMTDGAVQHRFRASDRRTVKV